MHTEGNYKSNASQSTILSVHLDQHFSFNLSIFRIYGSFTMETILATAFGRVIDVQRGDSDELTMAVDSIFRGVQEGQSLDARSIILVLSKSLNLKFNDVSHISYTVYAETPPCTWLLPVMRSSLQWNIWEWILGLMYVTIPFIIFSLYMCTSCKATHQQKEGWRFLQTLKCPLKVRFTLEILPDGRAIILFESDSAFWAGWCQTELSLHSPSQNVYHSYKYRLTLWCQLISCQNYNSLTIVNNHSISACTTQQ